MLWYTKCRIHFRISYLGFHYTNIQKIENGSLVKRNVLLLPIWQENFMWSDKSTPPMYWLYSQITVGHEPFTLSFDLSTRLTISFATLESCKIKRWRICCKSILQCTYQGIMIPKYSKSNHKCTYQGTMIPKYSKSNHKFTYQGIRIVSPSEYFESVLNEWPAIPLMPFSNNAAISVGLIHNNWCPSDFSKAII